MPQEDALRIRQVRAPCQRSDIKSFWQLIFLSVAMPHSSRDLCMSLVTAHSLRPEP